MAEESVARPFYTVLVLAFACSALVSMAAIGLRPMQEENRDNDMKKNILRAAGLYDAEKQVDTLFSSVETRVVELSTGKFVSEDTISPESYSQLKATLNENLSREIPENEDIAGLGRLEKYSLVYLVGKDGQIDQIILPVRGQGLWSTMYGYVSIDGDLETIRGISFYQHGETPGLGGEIENTRWQAGWEGKKMYGPDDRVLLQVAKGEAEATGKEAQYQVDGLSGATMTSEGVEDLMQFWFGDHGFKPFFERLEKTGGVNG